MSRRTESSGAPTETFLITRAQTGLDEQHRARVRRYFLMMSIRIPALILAALVYAWTGSGWWALAVLALSIPIPWIAVVLANDRPPRKRGEVPRYLYGADRTAIGPPQLPRPDGSGRVIDATVIDVTADGSGGETNSAGSQPGREPGSP